MVREIITINVGQAGIQSGSKVWEQYNLEHDIDNQGNIVMNDNDNQYLTFYCETDSGKYQARNLMIDLDPDAIESVKNSKYSQIYDPQYLLCHPDQAGGGGNFARGYGTVGKELISTVNDKLRLIAEKCDNVQGFMMNHSVGGGTGSGLGSLILENICKNHRKKAIFGFEIYPFNNNKSNNYVQVYNALLSTHWSLNHTDISFPFDNDQIYNLCKNKLWIKNPDCNDMNILMAKLISSETISLRFNYKSCRGVRIADLDEYQARMAPFPRLHFLTASMAPLIMTDDNRCRLDESKKNLVNGYVRRYCGSCDIYQDILNIIYSIYDINVDVKDRLSIHEMSLDMFNHEYFSINCPDFDNEEDKYMNVMLNYRGNVTDKEAIEQFHWAKMNRKLLFYDWDAHPNVDTFPDTQPAVSDDIMVATKSNCTMIANNTYISRFFSEKICKIFDKMYSQRAFVHWFVGEGMEEAEFADARQDLEFLEKDYIDVLGEQDTSDADCTEDE